MAVKYPFLVLHRRKWVVRMTVPADVRAAIGQAVFRISTGESDPHIAHGKAAPIIAALQRRIKKARESGAIATTSKTAALAAEYHALPEDSDPARKMLMGKILAHTGELERRNRTSLHQQLALRGPVIADAIAPSEAARVDLIRGNTTPFLKYLERWKPHAGLKPRPLDQAISSLNSFQQAVAEKSIEKLEAKHVQAWIDGMIDPKGETGIKAVTVKRKVGEVRNYWRYLQSVQIVPEDRDPFANRRIKDPSSRKESSDDKRQKWAPEQVRQLWESTAETDPPLHHAIKIAAYSGARIEGVAQLKISDIRFDAKTQIHFMHMADKSAAGDRDVPIHPAIKGLIDGLVKTADADGYLIRSDAKNKYGERSQPLGKRFGRLKAKLGFDGRYVFHSIRKTVTSLMQDAQVTENVAADIVGHVKPGMTFGLYGGITDMGLRARELTRSVVYATAANGEASTNSST